MNYMHEASNSLDCQHGERAETVDESMVELLNVPSSPSPSNSSASSALESSISLEFDDVSSMSFLERLYAMLEGCPPNFASWASDGMGFEIYDAAALEAAVLPRYFQPIKVASFFRQLSVYHFKKTKRTTNVVRYEHSLFKRGRPDLLPGIKRRYRVRPSRSKVKPSVVVTRSELRSTFSDLVASVTSLRSELAEAKASLQAMVEAERSTTSA
ncbi:hypothetical protein AeRB84_000774 [Aphanomyces euteiches]|nr:hypothetical protein AeRB84_000774 [Aphanomyces euteiches]